MDTQTGKIEEDFKGLMEKVHPEGVPPAQWESMRMAFYGGASAIIIILEKLGDPSVPVAEAVYMMERLQSECTAFAKKMKEKGKG